MQSEDFFIDNIFVSVNKTIDDVIKSWENLERATLLNIGRHHSMGEYVSGESVDITNFLCSPFHEGKIGVIYWLNPHSKTKRLKSFGSNCYLGEMDYGENLSTEEEDGNISWDTIWGRKKINVTEGEGKVIEPSKVKYGFDKRFVITINLDAFCCKEATFFTPRGYDGETNWKQRVDEAMDILKVLKWPDMINFIMPEGNQHIPQNKSDKVRKYVDEKLRQTYNIDRLLDGEDKWNTQKKAIANHYRKRFCSFCVHEGSFSPKELHSYYTFAVKLVKHLAFTHDFIHEKDHILRYIIEEKLQEPFTRILAALRDSMIHLSRYISQTSDADIAYSAYCNLMDFFRKMLKNKDYIPAAIEFIDVFGKHSTESILDCMKNFPKHVEMYSKLAKRTRKHLPKAMLYLAGMLKQIQNEGYTIEPVHIFPYITIMPAFIEDFFHIRKKPASSLKYYVNRVVNLTLYREGREFKNNLLLPPEPVSIRNNQSHAL